MSIKIKKTYELSPIVFSNFKFITKLIRHIWLNIEIKIVIEIKKFKKNIYDCPRHPNIKNNCLHKLWLSSSRQENLRKIKK
mgnify:CR=1 FL=1